MEEENYENRRFKKGPKMHWKKTVDGAKDLTDKAADKTKIAGSEVAQNIKRNWRSFEKTVEGAKDLANKAANNKIVKDVEKVLKKQLTKL